MIKTALFTVLLAQVGPSDASTEARMAERVEIIRTEYGVPHVYADDLEAMGFALGWLQMEDYGPDVAVTLLKARGEHALHVGRDSIDADFVRREAYLRAVETHASLSRETRAVYRGFAAGVNHYLRLHPDEGPAWLTPTLTAYDAHARDVQTWSRADARRFVEGLEREEAASGHSGGPQSGVRFPPTPSGGGWAQDDAYLNDGSNAWAFTGERSVTGQALLLRNPHLSWDAGYYEAHVVVRDTLEFYGDFRIGGAFGIIGGFNRDLGWATTNNYPRYSQVYRLEAAPHRPDHYRFEDRTHPLEARTAAVRYRTAAGDTAQETRTTHWTVVGPVIHRDDHSVWVLRDPRDGEYRRGEQFLRMMRASTLVEWLDVMRMRAHTSSNFTYADRAGNAVHYYNALLPLLPHEPTGDTAAAAESWDDVWTEVVPFDRLPLYVNPPGGYVQQANDTPDYTNLNVPLDRDTMPANLPAPRLRLRSQLSLDLVHGTGPMSLEEMMVRKHSPRMMVAERSADELVAILHAAPLSPEERAAVGVLDRWDRTARAESKGAVLFVEWFAEYMDRTDGAGWAQPWSPLAPISTPRGIGDAGTAVAAFRTALERLRAEGIDADAAWGEVHRVVRGDVDAPVSGCGAVLGCFRTLSFEGLGNGRRAADRGDGWVFGVEFGEVPRAFTVLAYGQSGRPESPHYDDQAALFAEGRMKPIRWTREDVEEHQVRRYRPGREAGR